jgi:hypothetical protein
MNDPNVNIYQIFFKEEQRAILDPAFKPYDNINPSIGAELSNKFREWPIIRQLGYQQAQSDKSDIWGFVSYKFQEKTNTTGDKFVKFIKDNPDNDVWFMEPYYRPANPFFNPWMQGEVYHKGISQIPNFLFELAGNPTDVLKIPMRFCWYNFFAGTPKFWNQYFTVIDEMIDVSEKHPALNQIMFDTGAGHGNDPTVPYFIFVVERMFPTLLAMSDLKAAGMIYQHADFVYG